MSDTEILLQVGRAVYINYGPTAGKLAVVIDLINDNSVLIDGPTTGVDRQMIPMKRLALTAFKVAGVTRNMRRSRLTDAITKFNLVERWSKTGFAQKLAKQERRANLTDFERFQAMLLKRKVGKTVRKWLKEKRKSLL